MVVAVGVGSGGKRGQQRGRWPGVGGTFVMQDGRSGGGSVFDQGRGQRGCPQTRDAWCWRVCCLLSICMSGFLEMFFESHSYVMCCYL